MSVKTQHVVYRSPNSLVNPRASDIALQKALLHETRVQSENHNCTYDEVGCELVDYCYV